MKLTPIQLSGLRVFINHINSTLVKSGLVSAFDIRETTGSDGEKRYFFSCSIPEFMLNAEADRKKQCDSK